MTEPNATMPRFEGRFAGRIALITGGASGIGAATARRFLEEGGKVALCDLSAEGLAAFAAEVGHGNSGDGDRLFHRAVDVADAGALTAFIDDAAAHFGGLDILVNNAGMGAFGHIDEITPETWHKVMAVDVDALFYGCRAALPWLRKADGAAIVNTASISGLLADPGLVAYNTAKAAVVNFTRNLAVDHADEGIRVNCICPGGVATPMTKAHTRDADFMGEYERLVPLARLGTAEEMAAAILFLASRDAAYITGHALVVDGGVTVSTGQPHFDRLYRARGWDKAIRARQ